MDIEVELQSVFREVFDADDLCIDRATTATDVEGWDSMAQINLIVAVEKHFSVKFPAAELSEMRQGDGNVGILLDLLSARVEATH
ncbi:MAG: hypothetical protein CL917_08510 [Deltaproteobacteria bacterium]|nr:hypothetical protein [Deltaproteobacteria bacterium]